MEEQDRVVLNSLALAIEETCRPPQPELPWTSRVATGALCLGTLALFGYFTVTLPILGLLEWYHRHSRPSQDPTPLILWLLSVPLIVWWAWRARADLPPERDVDGRLGSPNRLVLRNFFSQVVVFLPDLAFQFFQLTVAPAHRRMFPGLMGAGLFWLVALRKIEGRPDNWVGPLSRLIGPLPEKDLVRLAGILRKHRLLRVHAPYSEPGQLVERWELGPVGHLLARQFGLTGRADPTGAPAGLDSQLAA